ncbi:MAG: alpha/beta hydrolase, partial [Promethearchaeota archaeon]
MKFIMESEIRALRSEFKGSHEIINTSDGIELFLRTWLPIKHSNVGILLFHGITAYSKPYEIIGVPFSKNGYAVYGLDIRGHGLSDGIRGDYPSMERLVADLGHAIQLVKSKHDKLVILGHSLGVVTALIASNN